MRKAKIHGTAKQYGRNGKVIGKYTIVHGTGFDIWRQEDEDNTISFPKSIVCRMAFQTVMNGVLHRLDRTYGGKTLAYGKYMDRTSVEQQRKTPARISEVLYCRSNSLQNKNTSKWR